MNFQFFEIESNEARPRWEDTQKSTGNRVWTWAERSGNHPGFKQLLMNFCRYALCEPSFNFHSYHLMIMIVLTIFSFFTELNIEYCSSDISRWLLIGLNHYNIKLINISLMRLKANKYQYPKEVISKWRYQYFTLVSSQSIEELTQCYRNIDSKITDEVSLSFHDTKMLITALQAVSEPVC